MSELNEIKMSVWNGESYDEWSLGNADPYYELRCRAIYAVNNMDKEQLEKFVDEMGVADIDIFTSQDMWGV